MNDANLDYNVASRSERFKKPDLLGRLEEGPAARLHSEIGCQLRKEEREEEDREEDE